MKRRGVDSLESWVVAGASSVVYLLAPWPMRLGGQLFVSMLDHFDANRKDASFPFALAYLMRSLSGPFAGYFSVKIGLQAVTLIGAVLCAIGIGGCFFAEDIITVNVSLGLIFGIGYGWATAVIPEILNHHFNKHRSKANGFVFGGSGLGSFVTPPLLAYILITYGMSGTFLLMSAILLHGVPFSMLLTKPRHITNNPKNKKSEPCSDVVCISTNNFSDSPKTHNNEWDSKPTKKQDPFLNKKNDFIIREQTKIRTNSDFNQTDETKINKLSMQKLEYNLELFYQKDFKEPPFKTTIAPIEFDSKVKLKISKQSSEKQCSSSINVLWSPIFLLVTTVTSAHFYLQYTYWTIIVDVGRDKGSDQHQEVYLVMALSLFDMLGRFSLGVVIDSGFMSNVNFCVFCFACMGLLCFVMAWLSGFLAILIVTSLLGVIIGGNTTGLPGLVTEFFQKEKRSMAMASRLIMYAPMSFTMSPLIGYFRGTLGSYDGLLYVLMILCLLCVFLLLILSKSAKDKENR